MDYESMKGGTADVPAGEQGVEMAPEEIQDKVREIMTHQKLGRALGEQIDKDPVEYTADILAGLKDVPHEKMIDAVEAVRLEALEAYQNRRAKGESYAYDEKRAHLLLDVSNRLKMSEQKGTVN